MTEPHPNLAILGRHNPANLAESADVFADDAVWHFFNPRLPDMQGDYVGPRGIGEFFAKLAAKTPLASQTTASLDAVWGTSSSDVYAVGWEGTILHYDGTEWSAMPSGTTAHLHDVWGMSSSDFYAVGAYGVILRGTR